MSALNNSNDDVAECPLCMEPLEVDDLNFYPCTCGYQICRFCWHRIRTDENELCPACRKAYPENPADFKPLSQEQVSFHSNMIFFVIWSELHFRNEFSFIFINVNCSSFLDFGIKIGETATGSTAKAKNLGKP